MSVRDASYTFTIKKTTKYKVDINTILVVDWLTTVQNKCGTTEHVKVVKKTGKCAILNINSPKHTNGAKEHTIKAIEKYNFKISSSGRRGTDKTVRSIKKFKNNYKNTTRKMANGEERMELSQLCVRHKQIETMRLRSLMHDGGDAQEPS